MPHYFFRISVNRVIAPFYKRTQITVDIPIAIIRLLKGQIIQVVWQRKREVFYSAVSLEAALFYFLRFLALYAFLILQDFKSYKKEKHHEKTRKTAVFCGNNGSAHLPALRGAECNAI